MATFKTTGAKAGMENFLSEFNTPKKSAAMEMKYMNGKRYLVSCTVRANLAASFMKPGAMTLTIGYAKTTPSAVNNTRMMFRTVRTFDVRSQTSSFFFFSRYSVKTGMKAEDSAPSASRFLSMRSEE